MSASSSSLLAKIAKSFGFRPALAPPARPIASALEDLRREFEERSLEEPKTRLPSHLPSPLSEFLSSSKNTPPGWWFSFDNKTRRLAILAWKDISDVRNRSLFMYSVLGICCLSSVEGAAVLQQSALPLAEPSNALLLSKYSLSNILPSCVWHTNEMATVASSIGLDPSTIAPLEGSALIHDTNLRSARYIVATTTLISQLLRLFSVSVRASEKFSENIQYGREKPFNNLDERVIRLCGRKSDVTVVSLEKYGEHIFPIYEDPSAVRWTVAKYSDDHNKPVFWAVDAKSYGHKRAFEKLTIDDRWLVTCTSAGRRLLICEADLVNEEESLSLSSVSRDLTIDDASGAFRELMARARECVETKNYRVLRVVLGDSTEIFRSGGGHSRTLRDRVLGSKEADLIVDSRAPVLLALLHWFDKEYGNGGGGGDEDGTRRRLYFFTDSATYFTNLRELLIPFNIQVVDGFLSGSKGDLQDEEGASSESSPPPTLGLVHYTTTSLTTNTTLGLTKQGLLKQFSGVCVLVDKPTGIRPIEAEAEENDNASNLSTICSSLVHDKLLHQVRVWSRMGFSPASIQEELDFQFAKVLEAEASVSNSNGPPEKSAAAASAILEVTPSADDPPPS